MSRSSIVTIAFTVVLTGCIHAPPNYPGAGGDNLNPADYMETPCPDISGRYVGRGTLVEGDPAAEKMERSRRMDYVFPFRDSAQAMEVIGSMRGGIPEVGEVVFRNRNANIKLRISNGEIVDYDSSFANRNRFVCTGVAGKIVWGGVSQGGRSEFGTNGSDSMAALYLDENGDLIYENRTQVHMSFSLGGIPTGTARYFKIYRFRRLR